MVDLVERMRRGDREAAAAFVTRFGPRIRRRVRGKLSHSMRRLFDSLDILSTVGRRLDSYVAQGRVDIEAPEQLWALIATIADRALIDKARLYRRLDSVEGSDSELARAMASRLRAAESMHDAGAEIEIGNVMRQVDDDVDRQILFMWLADETHESIAEELGISSQYVRKRWERLRSRLREKFDNGTL